MNSEMIYSSNDYGEFNKIIQTNNKEEKTTKDKNKKVKEASYLDKKRSNDLIIFN